jgi:hypothetical protein
MVPAGSDIFLAARQAIDQLSVRTVTELDSIIQLRRETVQTAVDWLVLLMLQAPRAAAAQIMMDQHPHGYRDRDKRLYELIDFNDTFVDAVLLVAEDDLAMFVDKLREEINHFCRRLRAQTFSDEQYEAITHGLSREIAVYAAAKKHGFEVVMTSRTADAFGIDMQIRDSESGRYINVDCKTGSAFHFRLKDLVHEGRIAPHHMTDAETKGYWEIVNRRDDRRGVRIILLRIDQDELGPITAFRFEDETALVRRLREVIDLRGLTDGQFGQID